MPKVGQHHACNLLVCSCGCCDIWNAEVLLQHVVEHYGAAQQAACL